MRFSDVIGQTYPKQLLRQMATGSRLPHALLFLGPAGSGKKALALALAQYVLCENPGPEDACGLCNACRKVDKLLHPDLHFSFPSIGANATSEIFLPQWRSAIAENPYFDVNHWLQLIGADNKQGNITKEECVNIIRKLSLKTFEGEYKILIMWLPEYLGKEGNRLLKMIEEPPDQTLFFLLAENQELILPTILSRCQLVKVNPLHDEEVVEGLVRREVAGQREAESVAYLSNGNFFEACKLAADHQNDYATKLLDWLRKAYGGNGVELVRWSEEIAGIGREKQKQFLRYALHFMREYMALLVTGNAQVRLQPEELQTAQKLTTVIAFDQITLIAQLFDDCSYHVERNANPKVLFLDASIQMHHIIKRKIAAPSPAS